MRRFIVTNYEIYLDYFKHHSEQVALKHFSKCFQSLTRKVSTSEEQVLLSSPLNKQIRQSLLQTSKASIISKMTGGTQKNDVDTLQWTRVFEFMDAFSYIAQMASEKIPLDEGKKVD